MSGGGDGPRSLRPDGSWRPRPTVYKGIHVRSRLEASWAAEFDADTSLSWEYEPQCFATELHQYLPDFRVVDGSEPSYIEVKPASLSAQDLNSLQRLMSSTIWASERGVRLRIYVGAPDEYAAFSAYYDSEAHVGLWFPG